MKRFLIIIIILLSFNRLYSKPTEADYVSAYSGLGVWAVYELAVKENIAPEKPRWTGPALIDDNIRRLCLWEKPDKAKRISDFLLGGIVAGAAAVPAACDNNYSQLLLINSTALAITGLSTEIVKLLFARQRPYIYYNTREAGDGIDNLSFFSGHSSVAFSMAVSSAYILHREIGKEGYTTTIPLLLAATTAYLRIAGDMHYFSDVITGAAAGALIGYFTARYMYDNKIDKAPQDPKPVPIISMSIAF